MIRYILIRMGGGVSTSAATMLLIVITIAMAPSLTGLFVSSFHTAKLPNKLHRTRSINTAIRIPPTSSSQLYLSSTTATTSAATLSYLNSLQSITSNPQLFPATSDTIEALLSQQQQQQLPYVNSNNNEISPRDFLMNLSREVMLASTGKDEEELAQGAHSMHSNGVDSTASSSAAPTADIGATSAASNVNLISEGMTAEEAAAIRNNRLHQSAENKVDDNNNNNNSSMMSNIAMTITEGMTAEDAQKARMARPHSSTLSSFDTATTTASIQDEDDSTINTPPSTIPQNNRGVSGLRQAASMRIKEPLSQAAQDGAAAVDGTSSSSYDNEASAIQDDELLSSMTASTTKFLGVPMTKNPNTPLIATTTGIATGVASYKLIDEYAYQFNTVHNGMIVDMMDKKQEFVEQWDELIGAYLVPVEDVDGGVVVGGGGGVDDVGAAAPAMEFSGVDSSSSAAVAAPVPETAMEAASTPNEVTMDNQGSVINTPVEASSADSVAATAAQMEQLSDASVGSETATVTLSPAPMQAATAESTSTVAPSLSEMSSVDEGAASTPALSLESENMNVLSDATATAPVPEVTQYAETASSSESTAAVPSLNVGTVEEVATNNAPVSAYESGSGNMDLLTDGTSAAAVVEPLQYSDVAGAGTITAAPSSLNEATTVDVAAPVEATKYADAASTIESTTVTPMEEVVSNAPVTSYESGHADLMADATPAEHAHSDIPGAEEVINVDQNAPVSSYESGNTDLLADATTSAAVDPAQQYSDVGNDAPPPTFENGHTDLLADATTSATAEPHQYSETITAPSMNGATMNQDVGNAPASNFENGNTDLLADATTSAPVASTQFSDVSGADTANAAPSLNDVNSIDQNVMNADSLADSTHQQRWFTAPPTADEYTHTDYTTTVDQNGYSSGGFSFDGGTNGGSFASEHYSSWQPQGGPNPLRDLAASLPPPEDRVRITGGDYYQEDVASQWAATQGDGFHTVADTNGMDGLADSLLSTDYSNPPISNGEFEVPASAIPSDAMDSFTTQSPDISYDHFFNGADKIESNSLSEVASSSGASMNDALISAKAKLFGSVSHSLGDIQGKVNAGVSSMKGAGNGAHMPFDTHSLDGSQFTAELQNAGEAFQSIHPPAVVSSAIQHASDASLADIGHGIMDAVKFMAGILLTVVDANLDLAAPGSSSVIVLESVKSSVNSMLDNASYTVANVINDVGNLSLKDIVHNLMVLIVATADMIMKVMNAVIYLLTGKDTGNWVLQATSTVNEASSQLLAQADDVTHQSIGELASSIGDYSYHVGNELVALLGSLNGVDGAHFDGTLDMVTTAMQTGFTM
mmetsp:Transcript_32738/g.66883  ORF Transcript_32738/g.66883 Transcript_32738/m.66883 type:complete len:1330 (-) Transcript_32738:1710-5699(-)